jgi:hypothetical protein
MKRLTIISVFLANCCFAQIKLCEHTKSYYAPYDSIKTIIETEYQIIENPKDSTKSRIKTSTTVSFYSPDRTLSRVVVLGVGGDTVDVYNYNYDSKGNITSIRRYNKNYNGTFVTFSCKNACSQVTLFNAKSPYAIYYYNSAQIETAFVRLSKSFLDPIRDSSSVTVLNDSLKVYTNFHNEQYSGYDSTVYNNFHDIVLKISFQFPDGPLSKYSYEYAYDTNGQWVTRKKLYYNKITNITEREYKRY